MFFATMLTNVFGKISHLFCKTIKSYYHHQSLLVKYTLSMFCCFKICLASWKKNNFRSALYLLSKECHETVTYTIIVESQKHNLHFFKSLHGSKLIIYFLELSCPVQYKNI